MQQEHAFKCNMTAEKKDQIRKKTINPTFLSVTMFKEISYTIIPEATVSPVVQEDLCYGLWIMGCKRLPHISLKNWLFFAAYPKSDQFCTI